MNFKEALIAHLQGEKVEARAAQMDVPWKDFIAYHGQCHLAQITEHDFGGACEYRLAPRTIFVNGVEVPAPEKVAPDNGVNFYTPEPCGEFFFGRLVWCGGRLGDRLLAAGLVYLNREDAIARAKAMLLTSDK